MINIKQLYIILHDAYGPQGWWPINQTYIKDNKHKEKSSKEQFEIAIGAILTQNTSWTNVELALANLKQAKIFSKEKILQTSDHVLAQIIKPSGYNNQKARKLKEFSKHFKEPTREHLLSLWGIGPETADSILLYAYNHPTFVIDTYTKRLISRLGIIKQYQGIDPKKIDYHDLKNEFESQLENDHKLFNEFHALIVEHAKQHCMAKPKCQECPLLSQCKTGNKENSKNL